MKNQIAENRHLPG